MNRKALLLALWIVAAIFPFGWLTLFSRRYARTFNAVFALEAAHVAAHVVLYFGMACLAAHAGGVRALRGWRVMALAGMVVAASLAQEALQLWYKRRAWGVPETFDVFTDLVAALAALLAVRALARIRARRERALL